MTIPGFKLDAGNERSNDAARRRGDVQQATSYPPPLPEVDASAQESEPESGPDASTAPTMRPPASAPSDAAAAASAPASPARFAPEPALASAPSLATANAAERDANLGFTSVIRHLSLRGWLRWIHSNRSDATLRVRTRDGGNGRIWCSAGKIVDAEWGRLTAEEAMREMLSLGSGAVTIDFARSNRPRRIMRGTHEMLHPPEGSHGRVTDMAHAEAALAASGVAGVRSEPFRSSLYLPTSGEPTSAHATLLRARPDPRRISRGEYLAGVFLLAALAIAAFSFGRMRAVSQAVALNEAEALQTEQTKAGLLPPPGAQTAVTREAAVAPNPPELPLISFVAIEVDPPRAEIWLDQELIGMGRIQLGPIRDGVLHELRFMSPGHETKSLFFRDTPPAGRVALARIADAPIVAEATSEAASEAPSVGGAPPGSEQAREEEREVKRTLRRRPPSPPARERPAAEVAPQPAAKAVQPKTSPRVQLIEVHAPRVQVLD